MNALLQLVHGFKCVTLLCDPQSGWYQRTEMCRKVDANGFSGCPYLFSTSKICESDSTQRPGCAGFFQESYMTKFRLYGGIAVMTALLEVSASVLPAYALCFLIRCRCCRCCAFFPCACSSQIVTMVMACCYCFKRKYTDVLPPYKPFSAAEYEKYRFGVVGQDDPLTVEVPLGSGKAEGKGKPGAAGEEAKAAEPAAGTMPARAVFAGACCFMLLHMH